MSIEEKLENLTNVVQALTNAILSASHSLQPSVVAAVGANPVMTATEVVANQKRGPGRPPKAQPEATAEQKAAAPTDPAPEAGPDPFAVAAAPAPKREDVRAALVALQGRSTPAKAQGLLKSVGGVDTLPALPEDKFAAVISAAEKA